MLGCLIRVYSLPLPLNTRIRSGETSITYPPYPSLRMRTNGEYAVTTCNKLGSEDLWKIEHIRRANLAVENGHQQKLDLCDLFDYFRFTQDEIHHRGHNLELRSSFRISSEKCSSRYAG